MSEAHSPQEVGRHIRIYVAVFVALLVGTIVTVWLNYLHFDSVVLTVSIALFVATVKAFLVAGYFMHLMSEKKVIYSILGVTVFFFAAMMYLCVWSRDAVPRGAEWQLKGQSLPAAKSAH
jgi:cytochrome c oxidase subunit 4